MIDGETLAAPRISALTAHPLDGAPDIARGLRIATTHRLQEVEAAWRELEAQGIESPGQSFDFIRLWIESLHIPEADRLFVTAMAGGRVVALLPLHRRSRWGIRAWGWFPGPHVGCSAPLLDASWFAGLCTRERAAFWAQMLARLPGADLVNLADVPETAYGLNGAFAEMGRSVPTDMLHRAAFASWDEANATQRSKSRRKHDRQQGERLDALGTVTFEVVDGGPEASPVLTEMFRQRAHRFQAMGVADPFAAPRIASFYAATIGERSGVAVKLHVLRLDGKVVATRYNIAAGDRLFCLVSSMSDDARIQGGSPGKQCLLRVMQTVFDAGFRVFDMGCGLTDEKRHWCNVGIGLRRHYVALTPLGHAALALDALAQSARARIKADKRLFALAKALRTRLRRGTAAMPPGAFQDQIEAVPQLPSPLAGEGPAGGEGGAADPLAAPSSAPIGAPSPARGEGKASALHHDPR